VFFQVFIGLQAGLSLFLLVLSRLSRYNARCFFSFKKLTNEEVPV
jgi:hypothetical protein